MTQATESWHDVGAVEDIPTEGSRVVKTSFGSVAVIRTAADQVFAIEDKCPHLGGPLSQGIVHGARVTCPLHNWVIDLASGGVVGPDEGCVVTVPVKLDAGRVLLDVSVLVPQAA